MFAVDTRLSNTQVLVVYEVDDPEVAHIAVRGRMPGSPYTEADNANAIKAISGRLDNKQDLKQEELTIRAALREYENVSLTGYSLG
eukprot:1204543-Pleurochrysis_carterae.AAC.1